MNTTIFILLGFLIAVGLYKLREGVMRKKAMYKLFAVRDELVCLVAEDKLSETDRIFQYYYKRINMLLQLAPDVGLDNSVEAFLYLQNTKGFEHSLQEANRRADEMLELVADASKDVSDVIADYYAASKNMMLAHSSFLRMAYLLVMKYHLPKLIEKQLGPLVPEPTQKVMRTVKFAGCEEDRFRHVFNHKAA